MFFFYQFYLLRSDTVYMLDHINTCFYTVLKSFTSDTVCGSLDIQRLCLFHNGANLIIGDETRDEFIRSHSCSTRCDEDFQDIYSVEHIFTGGSSELFHS